MSAITVNAFPPLHAFNSSRGWFLALIVLLHAGFFWVLTHGVTIGSIKTEPAADRRRSDTCADPEPLPPPTPVKPVDPRRSSDVFVPKVEQPDCRHEDDPERRPARSRDEPQPTAADRQLEGPGSGPRIVEPADRCAISVQEPEYPVPEIRHEHARHGVAVGADPAERSRRRGAHRSVERLCEAR